MIRELQAKTSGPQRGTSPRDLIGTLISEALLSRATSLARKGEYTAAVNLLKQLVDIDTENARALDLLARIHAQQGRFSEAEVFWKRALEVDPNNELYFAGLKRIAQMRSRPLWAGVLLPMVAAFIAILLISLVAFVVRNQIVHLRELLLTEVARIKTAVESEDKTNVVTSVQSLLQLTIQLDGVSVKTEQGRLAVLFDEGLFLSGARLKPEAKTLLSQLGKQLQPHASNISIRIVGHTDDIPVLRSGVYRDNAALGMARANAVADYISRVTGIPMSVFHLQSAGESQPPYPNDTLTNKLRNRTVVIYISPVENRQGGKP
ncbi:MAG: OmpA family protein [bacterium JZ-2024 1]